ncbi:hypothetical protein NL676_020210 [Syzygium grande]|nr:hypothetical protein NL676_020210 [Syzygium grande]
MLEIESNPDDVLDELYELYTELVTSLMDENAVKGNVRALKYISFLFPDDASCEDAMGLQPDIILGADVIYDPLCLPHLVHLVSILVDKSKSSSRFPRAGCDSAIGGSHDYSDRCNSLDVKAACHTAGNASPTKHPIAYISSVIRNANTFDRFLALVDEANLFIADLTGTLQPASLLP